MGKEKPSARRSDIAFFDRCPEFFKIYAPQAHSQRLRIPPAFLKNFEGNLPRKIKLKSPTRKLWNIDVIRENNNLFLDKGWPDFIKCHSLEFGDFLTFCYIGISKFYVKIFGNNLCPKKFASNTSHSQENQQNEDNSKELGSDDMNEEASQMLMCPWATDSEGNNVASNKACKHPCFHSVMSPSYVTKGILLIPARFHRSNMDYHTQKTGKFAILRRPDKDFKVKLIQRKHRLTFSGKWRQFVIDNNLQVGNECAFELIDKDDWVFNVRFLRAIVD